MDTPEERIKIAVQKSGRLTDHSLDLLARCGLKFTQSKDQLFCYGENMPVDLLLVQSDDLDRIDSVLKVVREHGKRVPTLVITAHRDTINEQEQFVHSITMQELLEGNLSWQIVLARSTRQVEQIREHFADADSVLILLQDDPDPDAIASGLALRQVLGATNRPR